ncbi:uncharacterized protein ARMOST_12367 [Armillaria ostoyae]|uniref:Uncharacterized protein n=1 Tax=Armillaria ostoyae TaxID=47428 RepID=A0A284RJQ2_ARMOS|nr:uncharacterized protein ARMOST_12367 [Armillaria ostoyae]
MVQLVTWRPPIRSLINRHCENPPLSVFHKALKIALRLELKENITGHYASDKQNPLTPLSAKLWTEPPTDPREDVHLPHSDCLVQADTIIVLPWHYHDIGAKSLCSSGSNPDSDHVL